MRKFECRYEPIDVTRSSRPDPSWLVVDQAGHDHRWFLDDGVTAATTYEPLMHYTLPTLRWVVDVEATDEQPERGRYVCRRCEQEVMPALCPDVFRHFIPGLVECFIDERPVTREEYEREWAKDSSGK